MATIKKKALRQDNLVNNSFIGLNDLYDIHERCNIYYYHYLCACESYFLSNGESFIYKNWLIAIVLTGNFYALHKRPGRCVAVLNAYVWVNMGHKFMVFKMLCDAEWE